MHKFSTPGVIAVLLFANGVQAQTIARPVTPPPAIPRALPGVVAQPSAQPRTYTVAIEGSGGCVLMQYTTAITQKPYLRGGPCRQQVTLKLHPIGEGRSKIEIESTGLCATVARGVIFGAPRIDALPCDGAPDQRFRVRGADGLDRQIMSIETINGKCWTLRGDPAGNAGMGSDLIELPCGGTPGQKFRLTPMTYG